MIEVFFILGIIMLLALLPLFVSAPKKLGGLNALGYLAVLAFSMPLCIKLTKGNLLFHNFFYLDPLSGFFILIISMVSFASSLYSIGYIQSDLKDGAISSRDSRIYYILYNLFTLSMFFAMLVNNIGIVWVSIEMTTLVSAFLVGFYKKEESIEAAWKYLIICSVGITLALLGIILFYYTASVYGGVKSLNWTDMVAMAPKLDPQILKIAFLFILVGYGTKAGIAPMHTWLPDAHSQALTPISALLSGVLLKTSLYAILRLTIIMNIAMGTGFTSNLFIFFGIISLLVSAGFILIQKDIKRLLAYSSIENIGIILFGIGTGGTIALYGALFHAFNHAATKSFMFFGAGKIVKKYKTHDMRLIHGAITSLPFIGTMLILGAFALGGSPPFSMFFSELLILIAGFTKGAYVSTGIFLTVIAFTFGAILLHFSKMVFGKKPDAMPVTTEDLGEKVVFVLLLLIIVSFGVCMPSFLNNIITSAVSVLTQGS